MSFLRHPVRWTLVPFLVVSLLLAWLLVTRTPLSNALSWLTAANLCALPVWWIDKLQARREGLRVPESTLHLTSLLGGAGGGLVAMNFLRHKTRKPVFWIVNTIALLVHVAALLWWYAPES